MLRLSAAAICRYEDDEEELEWDEVFNEAPMPGKNGVRVTPCTQEAKDFIASLFTPLKRQHMNPAHHRIKRIKADPDAISSSQAMQDAASASSQQGSFAEHHTSGAAMVSNSEQSSNPSMAELGLTGTDGLGLPEDEQIPSNKRQKTDSYRSDSQRRREAAAAAALPRFNEVLAFQNCVYSI